VLDVSQVFAKTESLQEQQAWLHRQIYPLKVNSCTGCFGDGAISSRRGSPGSWRMPARAHCCARRDPRPGVEGSKPASCGRCTLGDRQRRIDAIPSGTRHRLARGTRSWRQCLRHVGVGVMQRTDREWSLGRLRAGGCCLSMGCLERRLIPKIRSGSLAQAGRRCCWRQFPRGGRFDFSDHLPRPCWMAGMDQNAAISPTGRRCDDVGGAERRLD
jgi:hypothetical protein